MKSRKYKTRFTRNIGVNFSKGYVAYKEKNRARSTPCLSCHVYCTIKTPNEPGFQTRVSHPQFRIVGLSACKHVVDRDRPRRWTFRQRVAIGSAHRVRYRELSTVKQMRHFTMHHLRNVQYELSMRQYYKSGIWTPADDRPVGGKEYILVLHMVHQNNTNHKNANSEVARSY